MKRRRRIIISAVVLALLGGVYALARPRERPIEAKLATVKYTEFVTRLPETGVVQRPQTQTLAALVPGEIRAVRVGPGDRIAAGEVLVELSNPQLVSSEAGARAAYAAAGGHAASTAETNAVLPAQNRSSVVQAQYNLEQARSNLNAALTDRRNGAQSGLGYGGSTAQSQRVTADANVASAQTNLAEAQRIYDADLDLYANRAISKDALSQQAARLAGTRIAAEQAKRQRDDIYAQLAQNVSVLGDRVQAGRDAVRQAGAALDAARLQAGQTKAGDVDAARADVAARLNDLQYARDQVARLEIRAPFAGIVQTIATQGGDSLRPLGPGDSVTAGQAIVTIAADRGFIIRARVDEQDIAAVRSGQPARISGEDLGNATLRGHIIAVGQVAQKSDDPANTSRQIITTIALDGSLPYLRDGMNVDVDITTSDQRHVLAVQSDTIRRDGDATYVYVVRPGEKRVVRTAVRLGAANDTQTVVTGGLRPGQTVVDDRNPAIADNTTVTPVPSPSPGVRASGGG